MSVEKITDIGGMARLKRDGIGFTVHITQVERSIKSLDAKGLYVHLLGFPPDWKFYRKKLMADLNIGKDRLKKCLDELKELKLIVETEIRDEKGRFIENQMYISLGIMLAPQFQDVQVLVTPQADYPQAGKPASGKQPTININNNNKTKEKNIVDAPSSHTTAQNLDESKAELRWKEWQKIYPDNNGKKKCISKLGKMSSKEYEKLLEGTKIYLEMIDYIRSQGFKTRNVQNASTFINGKTYLEAQTTFDKEKEKYESMRNHKMTTKDYKIRTESDF